MLAKALSEHYIVVSYLNKGILAGITRIQISQPNDLEMFDAWYICGKISQASKYFNPPSRKFYLLIFLLSRYHLGFYKLILNNIISIGYDCL